jgi:hypothetical protein
MFSKRLIIAGLVGALAAVAVAKAVDHHFFADARRVHNIMLALQDRVSAPLDGGGLDLALYGAVLKPFFAPEVEVSLARRQWVFDRDELLRAIVGAKQGNPALAVSFAFDRRDVRVTRNQSALVVAWVKVENLNEAFEPQALVFHCQKNEQKKWQINAITTPPNAEPRT